MSQKLVVLTKQKINILVSVVINLSQNNDSSNVWLPVLSWYRYLSTLKFNFDDYIN